MNLRVHAATPRVVWWLVELIERAVGPLYERGEERLEEASLKIEMADYLAIVETATECEACGADLGPRLIVLTDQIHGPARLAPQCKECLLSLDRRLAALLLAQFYLPG